MAVAADLYSFENLWRQYRTCRRNKRNTLNQLRFELDAEGELLELQGELREHTYRPGRSICFVTDGPKPREVFAADFRDRIVHHLLVSRLDPVFEPAFIHDSYACRKGKGVLAASDRLMEFLRRITANGQRPAWALKLDVASFFPSIDKQTLYAIIARRVRDPELRWLTRDDSLSRPDRRLPLQARAATCAAARPRPATRSRRRRASSATDNERGLPIGNLTSQFWANVYLNELDQFVKRELKCRYYVRYVDDLVLLDSRPETLAAGGMQLRRLSATRLKLRLRESDAAPQPVAPASTSSDGRPSGTIAGPAGGRWRAARHGSSVLRVGSYVRDGMAPHSFWMPSDSPRRCRGSAPHWHPTAAICATGRRTGSGWSCGSGAAGCGRCLCAPAWWVKTRWPVLPLGGPRFSTSTGG